MHNRYARTHAQTREFTWASFGCVRFAVLGVKMLLQNAWTCSRRTFVRDQHIYISKGSPSNATTAHIECNSESERSKRSRTSTHSVIWFAFWIEHQMNINIRWCVIVSACVCILRWHVCVGNFNAIAMQLHIWTGCNFCWCANYSWKITQISKHTQLNYQKL